MSELEREHREAMKARLAEFPKLSVGDAVEVKVRHDVDADAVDADDVVARVWALQYRLFRRPLAARAIPALPHGCTLLWAFHPALTLAGAELPPSRLRARLFYDIVPLCCDGCAPRPCGCACAHAASVVGPWLCMVGDFVVLVRCRGVCHTKRVCAPVRVVRPV